VEIRTRDRRTGRGGGGIFVSLFRFSSNVTFLTFRELAPVAKDRRRDGAGTEEEKCFCYCFSVH
jgi:hypothetical protein